jgi:hypothetical protein
VVNLDRCRNTVLTGRAPVVGRKKRRLQTRALPSAGDADAFGGEGVVPYYTLPQTLSEPRGTANLHAQQECSTVLQSPETPNARRKKGRSKRPPLTVPRDYGAATNRSSNIDNSLRRASFSGMRIRMTDCPSASIFKVATVFPSFENDCTDAEGCA